MFGKILGHINKVNLLRVFICGLHHCTSHLTIFFQITILEVVILAMTIMLAKYQKSLRRTDLATTFAGLKALGMVLR